MHASRQILAVTFLAMSLVLTGCPHNGGNGTDGGHGQTDGGGNGDGGGKTDGGGGDGGGGPSLCQNDYTDCAADQTCDPSTHKCVPAGPCNPQYGYANCNYDANGQNSDGAGCAMTTQQACTCIAPDPSKPTKGYCKKRLGLCDTCQTDDQCGSNPNYDQAQYCTTLGNEKDCLVKAGVMGCPQGYQPDANGTYCVPAGGDCASVFVCTKDTDCPSTRPVCNLSTGTCTQGCVFDLKTGASTCPTGKVCDQDGKCRAECDPNNDQCSKIDPSYVCKADTGGVHRCRIAGCIDSIECPVPTDPAYTGYCDPTTHACVANACRPSMTAADGSNPDCKQGYKCDSTGACVEMTCVEEGGAAIACGQTEFCCNECRNIYNDPSRDSCDPYVCTTETPATNGKPGCVNALQPPWCKACQQNSDCTFQNPKYDARDTDLCINSYCAYTCGSYADCPSGWACDNIPAPCQTDSDCGTGGTCIDVAPYTTACTTKNDCNQGYDCVADPSDGAMKCHAKQLECDCTAGGGGNDAACPQASRCQDLSTTAGFHKYRCIASKVCVGTKVLCGG